MTSHCKNHRAPSASVSACRVPKGHTGQKTTAGSIMLSYLLVKRTGNAYARIDRPHDVRWPAADASRAKGYARRR